MHLFWLLLWTTLGLIFVAFTFVIALGAPFLPTLKRHIPEALDLLDLKPGQTLLELGSGDGRVLIAAAKQDLNIVGYEINPLLAMYSWLRTYRYRKNIKIVWGNYWHQKLPITDGVFVFLLQPYMKKLDTKITQECKKPIKLVSFAFTIPDKKPARTKNGLYLYIYSESSS